MALPRWAALLLAGVAVLLLNGAAIHNAVVYALGVLLCVAAVIVLVVDLIGPR